MRVAPSTIAWPRPKIVVTPPASHQERYGGNLQDAEPFAQQRNREQGDPYQQGLLDEGGVGRGREGQPLEEQHEGDRPAEDAHDAQACPLSAP
jgi:hypothetical protein